MIQLQLLKLLLFGLLLLLQLPSSARCGIHRSQGSAPICKTYSCMKLATHMTKIMNLNATPCNDFYEYACGNFKHSFRYDPDVTKQYSKMKGSPDPINILFMYDIVQKQMDERLYELLSVRTTAAEESDNSELNQMFQMAYQMQLSCSRWVLKDDGDNNDKDNIFNDLLKPLLQKLQSGIDSLSAEKLLALIASSGGGSLVSVNYPKGLVRVNLIENLTHLMSAQITLSKLKPTISFDFAPYLKMLNQSTNQSIQLSIHGHEKILELTRVQLVKAIEDDKVKFNKSNNCIINSKCSLNELDSLSKYQQPEGSFSWKLFITELFNISSVDGSVTFVLNDAAGLIKLGNYIKRQPLWSNASILSPQMSFLIADWLLSFSHLMPANLRFQWYHEAYRHSEFLQKLKLYEAPSTFTDCVTWTRTLFQPIVQKMFQSKYYPNMYQDLNHFLEKISDAFVSNLEKSWLNDKSKKRMIKKIKLLKHEIAIRQFSQSQLRQMFADSLKEFHEAAAAPTAGNVSFGKMLAIGLRAASKRQLLMMSSQIRVDFQEMLNQWYYNAFFLPILNQVSFTLPVIQPPNYNVEYPDYINIGSLGFAISHEVSHTFDQRNALATHPMYFLLELDNQTKLELTKRINCVLNQISNEEIVPGVKCNGQITLLEDMSDIMGMSVTYEMWRLYSNKMMENNPNASLPRLPGYLSRLQPAQIVFLRAAQTFCMKAEPQAMLNFYQNRQQHSPARVRANSMMRNNENFMKHFDCKPGDAMVSNERCTFW